MKNILKFVFAFLLLATFACEDESLDPRPDLNDSVGAVTLVEVDPTRNFFNLLSADFPNEEVGFSVDIDGFELTEVSSVDIEVVYTERNGAYDVFLEDSVDVVFDAVLIGNITSFPSQVSVTAQQVADALGMPVGDFGVGDRFQITLPINTADGRRLTVALASDLCNEPAQPSFGGCGVAWAIACPSDIPTGAWTAPDGGTVQLTALGGGVYEFSNFNYSYYNASNNPIRGIFGDVCGGLSLQGATEFGVQWRGDGVYDATAGTISFPNGVEDTRYNPGTFGPSLTFTKQ